LEALVDTKDFAYFDGARYFITRRGEHFVEEEALIVPAQLTK
jgi:hypothetical protein